MSDELIILDGALSRRIARRIELAPLGYTIQCKQIPREIQGRDVESVIFDELTGGKDE